jgi:hypothetical protein
MNGFLRHIMGLNLDASKVKWPINIINPINHDDLGGI